MMEMGVILNDEVVTWLIEKAEEAGDTSTFVGVSDIIRVAVFRLRCDYINKKLDGKSIRNTLSMLKSDAPEKK